MIRYELEDFPEQNFYRNLGESTRYGIEVDTSFIAFKNHMVQGGITFASYQFLEEGVQKNLPGVPSTTTSLRWTYSKNNWNFLIDGRYIGSYFANNTNTVTIDHYGLANLKIEKNLTLDLPPFRLGALFLILLLQVILIILESMRLGIGFTNLPQEGKSFFR